MGASTLKGVNYTLQDSPATITLMNPGLWGGKVRVQNDSCDVSGIEAASTIKIAKIPAGATLLWGRIFIEANGTNVTFAVGDGTTADKFMAATAAAAASMLSFPNLIAQANLRVTVDTDIVITTAGATIASTKAIKTQVAYLLE
jgi:hypothetical protein